MASGNPPSNASIEQHKTISRSNSMSQASEGSQTAAEFIRSQLELEAEAREALPYQFDTCTRPLGALRQSLFSCLTCNPPPASSDEAYDAAGVCYSCSISCHGEHTLVELFTKRNFVCDCGTTRLPSTNPCTLRVNTETGTKGGVHSEKPDAGNKYNQNFRNRFCGCAETYDPHQEKGTMFQCLGLGTVEDGGCGEDWWHPECVTGLGRGAYKKSMESPTKPSEDSKTDSVTAITEKQESSTLSSIPEDGIAQPINGTNGTGDAGGATGEDDDPPLPPGFPNEDEFESLICYKCVESHPWIKRFIGTPGILPPVFYNPNQEPARPTAEVSESLLVGDATELPSRKRKAEEEDENTVGQSLEAAVINKRQKSVDITQSETRTVTLKTESAEAKPQSSACRIENLPPPPDGLFSLFLKNDFRDQLCHCPSCFPILSKHKQLLEDEEIYEPPISEDGEGQGGSIGTGSLLDRGEAAFSNVDRVRAIEGAMVYAHLKDKVKDFLRPFAESGQAVGAEDIKAYFEALRGDADAIKQAAGGASSSTTTQKKDDEGQGGGRSEQSGY